MPAGPGVSEPVSTTHCHTAILVTHTHPHFALKRKKKKKKAGLFRGCQAGLIRPGLCTHCWEEGGDRKVGVHGPRLDGEQRVWHALPLRGSLDSCLSSGAPSPAKGAISNQVRLGFHPKQVPQGLRWAVSLSAHILSTFPPCHLGPVPPCPAPPGLPSLCRAPGPASSQRQKSGLCLDSCLRLPGQPPVLRTWSLHDLHPHGLPMSGHRPA